jgi:hypothetical protein
VRDVGHGLTHDLMDNKGPEAEAMGKKRTLEMIEQVGSWLFNGPFAKERIGNRLDTCINTESLS